MFARRNVDPELERLREEVGGPPNLKDVALNIQRATEQIHASYLFENIGKRTLQILCLRLSGTAKRKTYNGWQEFAAHMGISMEQIHCIDYCFTGLQDPTYFVLLAYVQHSGATIDKILIVLQKIERFDVINEIQDYIYDIVNGVSQDSKRNESNILIPGEIPRAPLVLTPINAIQRVQISNNNNSGNVSRDSLQKTKQPRGPTVMLTFASDASEIARKVAEIFRSKQPRIRVLILQEQEKYVYSGATEFIDDCYRQVDFIIPILSQGYVERINNPKETYIEDPNELDAKYARYIYCLLKYEFVWNECKNRRVRCIVPDKDVSIVMSTFLHPSLQIWFTESNIDDLSRTIFYNTQHRY